MFNLKWGGVAAGTAFALALALSLIMGQTGPLIAFLRAVVFAALFFGMGTGTWSLINTFLPELLTADKSDTATNPFTAGTAGSRVDITVDDVQNAALPEQTFGPPGSDVGDFNDLFAAKDIDQTPATGYTEEVEAGLGALGDFGPETTDELTSEEGEFSAAFDNVNLGATEEDEDSGEFSMDFSAFVPSGLGEDNASDGSESGFDQKSDSDDDFSFFSDTLGSTKSEEAAVPERKVARNKPMQLEGDFNAKEIAAGLRTVLEKDKK